MKLYAGGSVNYSGSPYVSLREYDAADGSAGWTADHGGYIYGVATDDAGNVYIGGWRDSYTGNKTTRKYDSSGSLQWSVDHGATVNDVAADAAGNVYTGGNPSSSLTTRKYNSAGTEQWSVNHGSTVYCIAVDDSGNVYTGGIRTGLLTTRKYDSSGSLQWSVDHGATVFCIAVDSAGNVYTGGNSTGSVTVRKYNSAGSLQWSANSGGPDEDIAVDSAGNVYVCGGASSPYLRKYDSSGTEITTGWAKTTGLYYPQALAVDSADSVYVGGGISSSITTRKYNSAGTEQWTANHGVNYVFALAIYDPPPPVPGLPLAIAIGDISQDFAYPVPGLPLAIALAAPTPVGGAPMEPPDFAGTGERVFYRAYLTGEPTLLEILISSIQCRRRAGESTWLSVIAPGVPRALATRIQELLPASPSLLIYCGVRTASGAESFGELLRATLTEADYTVDAAVAPLTLTARVQTPTYSATTRPLIGVSARGRDKQGRRLARAMVDPLLQPGDTISDGVATWIAGALEYEITPTGAWMDVEEAD